MNEIKGLEKCILKYSSEDPASTTFLPVTEDYKGNLWTCKYNCSGFEPTKSCYRPISRYPTSTMYFKIVEEHYKNEKTK